MTWAAACAALLLNLSPPAGATSTYTAIASGELVRVGLKLEPGILAEQLLDPGATVAQASLDSLGSSSGFASHPYAGELITGAPSLVNGAAPVPTNLPDYPLYAASTYPSKPDSHVAAGPIALDATSRQVETRSSSTDGANRTTASVAADQSSEVVTSRAETVLAGIQLSNAVDISGIRTAAVVRRSAGGSLNRSTEFSIARLSVLGQSFRVTSNGVELVGQ
jgi:hypothetical protein